MSDKPVAMKMADELDSLCDPYDSAIATELRRLHSELERKSDAIQRLWKERDELRALNAELVEALRWYVDTDEVMEMEGNEFWLDGRERARAALAKVGDAAIRSRT